MSGVTFNATKKFDLQLSQALIDERRLAAIFSEANIEKIELKSESWLWERTGNICVEYRHNGQPSGISATEAGMWVHELKRDVGGEAVTLLYLMFPTPRLKDICRVAIRAKRVKLNCGDDGLSDVALLRLKDLLR